MRNNQLIEERKFYNYIYCDPRKPTSYKIKGVDIILPAEPFYVGRGTGRRYNNHLMPCHLTDDARNHFKKSVIKKIIKLELAPIIVIVSKGLTTEQANNQEKYLIRAIGRRDLGKGTLTNLTDGGEGSVGLKHTLESIKKIRDSKIGMEAWNKGIPMTEEAKANLSKLKKGKKLSRQHKLKIKNGSTINKEVHQYNLDGDYIRSFFSISEAAQLLNSKNITFITRCIKGDRPSGKGYLWSFDKLSKIPSHAERLKPKFGRKHSEETKAKMAKSRKLSFPVYKYDLDGNFIEGYKSGAEAKRQNDGCSRICVALQLKIPKAGNFLWSKYKYDKIDSYENMLAKKNEK